MTDLAPIAFTWTDAGTMMPSSRRFALQADKQYVVGETYVMVPHAARSSESHRHYFAAIKDAWLNLPEDMADEFPTTEHLRAWALMKAGYADKAVINCASRDDAIVLAADTRKRGPDDKIKIIDIHGRVVTIWTPHSQSMKAMGKQRFQESKQKVLDVIAGMIGVSSDALSSNAARAA